MSESRQYVELLVKKQSLTSPKAVREGCEAGVRFSTVAEPELIGGEDGAAADCSSHTAWLTAVDGTVELFEVDVLA